VKIDEHSETRTPSERLFECSGQDHELQHDAACCCSAQPLRLLYMAYPDYTSMWGANIKRLGSFLQILLISCCVSIVSPAVWGVPRFGSIADSTALCFIPQPKVQ